MKKLCEMALCLLPILGYTQHRKTIEGQPTLQIEEISKEKDINLVDVTAGLQTNHIWRGIVVTDIPMISGDISVNITKNFKVGVWGGTAIASNPNNTHYHEVTYYTKYFNDNFSIGVWDIFNATSFGDRISSDFFNYKQATSNHAFELRASYQFDNQFPLYVEANTFLYGGANSGEVIYNEKHEVEKQRHSSYIELGYPVIEKSVFKLNAFAGAGFSFFDNSSLYNPNKKFSISNVGFKASKDITVLGHKLPITFISMWNPGLKQGRIQIATTLF